jgi:hypothetical protein
VLLVAHAGAGSGSWLGLVAEGAEFIVSSATGWVTWHQTGLETTTHDAMPLKTGVN